MAPYQLFFRFEAAGIVRRLRGAQRAAVISFVDELKMSPNSLDDYSEMDEVGREVQIKVIGSFAVTFWADHAVREVKVVDIRRADQG